MIRGVVFDMDYTLYDRVETDRRAAAYLFDARRDLFAPGCTKEHAVRQAEIVSPVNSRRGWGYTTDYLVEQGVLAAPADSCEICALFQQRYREAIVPYPFAHDMLNALKGMGLRIGLITNGDEAYQSGKIRALGLDRIIPRILIGSDPATAKPHPDLFLKMADLLEAAPDQLLYVGDHPVNDVRASRGAGYTPVWVRACPWDEEGEPPEHAVDSVEGLDLYIQSHFELPTP